MSTYTPPALVDLGDVRTLTAADQTTVAVDQIFNNGQAIGSSVGSLDACVSPAKPPVPGSPCT